MDTVLAFCVAGLLTIFDLDQKFYIPRVIKRRVAVYGWMTFFVVVNGVLASVTYVVIRNVEPFATWDPFLTALAAGGGYLAIIHTKLTTFKWQEQDVPFGFELLYQGGRQFIYKRINLIAKEARGEETRALANELTLVDLARRARLSAVQDRLLSDEEKERHKQWIVSVVNDTESDDLDKRLSIANYILSGDR